MAATYGGRLDGNPGRTNGDNGALGRGVVVLGAWIGRLGGIAAARVRGVVDALANSVAELVVNEKQSVNDAPSADCFHPPQHRSRRD